MTTHAFDLPPEVAARLADLADRWDVSLLDMSVAAATVARTARTPSKRNYAPPASSTRSKTTVKARCAICATSAPRIRVSRASFG